MKTPNWLQSLRTLLTGHGTRKPIVKRSALRHVLELQRLDERITPTHFRYGTIDWAPTGVTNQISFHLTQAWRRSFPWSAPTPANIQVGSVVNTGQLFNFGDNTSAAINLTVTSVNLTDDWFFGQATISHTYSSAGDRIAFMTSAARISTLKNNADGGFRNETDVNVGTGNASPVSNLAPIIQVPDNQIWTFQVPAIDQNGDSLTYRLATPTEAGYTTPSSGILGQPTNFSVSSTGLISWNVLNAGGTATVANDLWTAQIMIEDRSPTGALKSAVPLDLIFQITNPQNQPPVVVANPTGPFQPTAGTTLTFDITATAQTGFNINSIVPLNAPTGMSFSSFGSPANVKTITATWTPTQAQSNQTFVVTFQASDNHSPVATGTTSVTISPQAAFFSTTTTINSPTITYNANGIVTVNVASAGGGTPTGNVTLSVDGGSPLTAPLNGSGAAIFTVPGLNAGNHALQANYAAQGQFLASAATGTLIVNPAPTAVQIQVADITYNEDGSANVTVTSAAGVPTGLVSLSVDGGTPITQSLVNGSTVFVIAAPDAGTHSLFASYAAQGNFAASSATATMDVNQAPTTVAIMAPTVTYNADGIVTLTVSASNGAPTPTGNVTLSVDGGAPVAAPLVNGSATFTIPSPSAGNHTLHAAYAEQGNYSGSTSDGVLHVNPAPTALFINAPTVTYNANGTVTLTVNSTNGAPTPTGSVTLSVDGGSPVSAPLVSGSANFVIPGLNAGDHNLFAVYAAQGNYAGSTAFGNLHVDQAALVVEVANVFTVYGDDDVDFSATASGLLNGDQVTFSFDSEGTEHHAEVGIYDIMISINPVGATNLNNYAITFIPGVLEVTPADLYVTADDNFKTYGETATDTGTLVGVNHHDDITATFTSAGDPAAANAGTYVIVGTLSDPDHRLHNYTIHSTNGTLTVYKATATIVVDGYSDIYDGQAHGATGSATGVFGEDLTALLDLGDEFTDYPGGTAFWDFAGNDNYEVDDGSVAIDIAKANATIDVDGYTGTYDADAHGLTGSATGVLGENLSSLLDLGPTQTNAGTYLTDWLFAGNTNYNTDAGAETIQIDKADATIVVNGYTGVYDGKGHGATGSAKGVSNEALAGLDFGASFTNVPGGTATWTFTDVTGNYNDDSGTAEVVITKATLTVTADDQDRVYGAPNPTLTATISGYVNGENASAITGAPDLTTTVTIASPVGPYAITAALGTLAADNYDFDFAPGTLTVSKASTATAAGVSAPTPLYGVDGITITAIITVVSPGSGDPSGTVTFYDGVNPLGTGSVVGGTASLVLSSTTLSVGGHTLSAVYGGDSNFFSSSSTTSTTVLAPSNVQGLVYIDFNNDGQVDFNEKAVAGVTLTLMGTDDLGNKINRTTLTDAQGIYTFGNLRPSNAAGYSVAETQPAGLIDGKETVGTINGVFIGNGAVNDTFSGIVFATDGQSAQNYNFGERPPTNGGVSGGQTATIGFWHNKNGQNLIKSLNGGANGTQLGNWLAVTFPNMYANLAGNTNTQVAAFYSGLFSRTSQSSPGGPPKMDAQVMATAFAVYVTNQSLAGNAATAYGFTVSTYGVGTKTFNVGAKGAAFGVGNNTSVSVLDLLFAVNSRSKNGLLYDMNANGSLSSQEITYRTMANDVFSGINEAGDI